MSPSSRLQQRMRPLPVWRCENCADGNINYRTGSSDTFSSSTTTSVEFGSIEIREYDRQLGTYDDLKNGGLALGWQYAQNDPIPVDAYENQSKSSKDPMPYCCRTSNSERQKIFSCFGFSKEELAAAERERLQNLRRHNTGRVVKFPGGVMRGVTLSLWRR